MDLEILSPSAEPREPLPRGITPRILLEHVRNTTPFVFDWHGDLPPYVETLKKSTPTEELSHAKYYELCVSAHWTTVATFVPTDVDNQIRFKLWHPALDKPTLRQMVEVVERAHAWSIPAVSARWIQHPENGFILSGHNGEWFSISAGAYGASLKKDPALAAQIAQVILKEMDDEAEVFEAFRKRKSGLDLLKASTLIAHNLGDLERVLDMWNVPLDNPLRTEIGSRMSATTPLWQAGELNRTIMAIENHRHFALRKPKALRRSSDFLLPIGPFFDDWGRKIAAHPELTDEERGDIAEALVDGWVFLKEPVGYARALAGMEEVMGLNRLTSVLPSRIAKTMKTGLLRSQIAIPQARFEGMLTKRCLSSI